MFPENTRQNNSTSEYWHKKVSGTFGQLYHYHSAPVFQAETNRSPKKTSMDDQLASPGETIFAGLVRMNSRVKQTN